MNFMISCIIILIFCLIFGVGISVQLIVVPLISLIEGMLILGIIYILSAINVYVQDIEYIVQFILNMLFYGTPVLYSLSQFSGANRILYSLIAYNPITILIDAYRDCFLYHVWPNWLALAAVACLSVVVILVGRVIFHKLERGFAEEL